MNKYLISYWKETEEGKDWFEKEIQANSIEDALTKFREQYRLYKIESIELISKSNYFTIRREIPRSVIGNVIVTAIEGGSNYWYYLSDSAVELIRKEVPESTEPYLSIALTKAILDHNVIVPINDAVDDLVVGYLSNETIQYRLSKLSKDSGLKWCLDAELSDSGDAETSDVVFQFLTMGEYVYG